MTREETASIIAVLCAAFPQVPVTRETIEVYHGVISDLDLASVRRAVESILVTSDRFPPPAQIRRRVADHRGLLAPSAATAWSEVTSRISDHGVRQYPTFSSPAIQSAVDKIGWREICMSTSVDVIYSHFRRAYEQEQARHDEDVVAIGTLSELCSATPIALPRSA